MQLLKEMSKDIFESQLLKKHSGSFSFFFPTIFAIFPAHRSDFKSQECYYTFDCIQ